MEFVVVYASEFHHKYGTIMVDIDPLTLIKKILLLCFLQHESAYSIFRQSYSYLFEKYTLVRTKTKRRMHRTLQSAHECHLKGKLTTAAVDQRIQSYLGILSHANQYELSQTIKNAYWLREP